MKRWGRYFDACVKCGTTEGKHYANGFCLDCYRADVKAKAQESAITDAPHEKVVVRKGDNWKVGSKSGFVWELKNGIVELRNYQYFPTKIYFFTIGELATGYIESDNPNGTVVWVGVL